MTILKLKYYKSNLSKWLLAVILLLSAFAFSGYSSNSNSLYQQKAQIELVCSVNKRTANQTASYKRLLHPGCKTHRYEIGILLHHNRLTQTKLDYISKNLYSIPHTARFIQIKTIPQTSSEDIFTSITG
jgi:hypothetical protein